MTADQDNPILEACLEEVLGGRTPPDLTERIVQAWKTRKAGNATEAKSDLNLSAALDANFAGASPQLVETRARSSNRIRARSISRPLMVVAVVACALGLLIAPFLFFWGRTDVAATAPQTAKPADNALAGPIAAPLESQPVPARGVEPIASSSAPKSSAPIDLATPNPGKSQEPSPQIAGAPPSSSRPIASPDTEVISFVNAELARTWRDAGVKPSPAATDAEWCRRLFVRVLGRIPSVPDELNPFLADSSRDKRQKLVTRLLTEQRYVDEYARHWSGIWTSVLIGRTGGRNAGLASREGLDQYLRGVLVRNQPYDQIVRDLLTASGAAQSGAAGYNPAVNFLLDGLDKDATLATSRVARVFLGQQLQCAQCHNHPTQDWSQDQFWALNSFFRQMKSERQGDQTKLVNVDFRGQGQKAAAGKVFYETPTGLLKTAVPRFIDGTQIPASGELADVDRRRELAKLVVRSDYLSKALVNRLWAHFFGFGFTRPVDDMGPNPSPPAAPVLDRLAREFAAGNYDLKRVMRWIVLSDPFARSSQLTDLATKDMPDSGEVALFSRYYSRQMQAEEVYNSLVQAAQIRKAAKSEAEIEKARVQWLAQFNRSMGTDDGQEETHFSGGLGQSLIMMNGDLMRRAVSSQDAGLLRSVAASEMKFEQKVEHLFLAALARKPIRRELNVANRVLTNSKGNESVALEDIWWAILNSNEFILDH